MPVGTLGCMYSFTCRGGNPPLTDRGLGCPPVGLGVKRAGSKLRGRGGVPRGGGGG